MDVRSPKEYQAGHIPGALNMPLLTDDQRAEAGTVYKHSGKLPAIQKGFDLAGPRFGEIHRFGRKLAKGGPLLLHCWRGGLRSQICSWIVKMADVEVYILEGGYKAWRQYINQPIEHSFGFLVLGGKTGSGKTEMLHILKGKGEQTLDLEGISHHRGSSFGSLGLPEQPTQEQFENLLGDALMQLDTSQPVWIENESRTIGRNVLPLSLFGKIKSSPIAMMQIPESQRLQRLEKEYAQFPKADLEAAIQRLQKRLGGLRTKQALEFLEAGHHQAWIALMLEYYDQTYLYGIENRINELEVIEWNWDNIDISLKNLMLWKQKNQITQNR